MRAVRRGDFPPPRKANEAVPATLEAICLKAMAREPASRYASPRDLAEEIERWLADEPVAAYREGWSPRLARWARRHKTWVAGAGALLTTAVVGLSIGTVLIEAARQGEAAARRLEAEHRRRAEDAGRAEAEARIRESDQRRLAESARQAEAEARQEAEAQLYLSSVALAGREWRVGNMARVEQLLNECPLEHRHWEWHYLKRQEHAGRRTLVGPHFGAVTALAFSPDGKRLVSAGWHETVKVWDAAEARVVLDLDGRSGHRGNVLAAAFSRDGRWIATAGDDQTVRLWDAADGKPGHVLRGHKAAVTSVAFSPDGRLLASAGRDQVVKLWDTASGERETHSPRPCGGGDGRGVQPRRPHSSPRPESSRTWRSGSGIRPRDEVRKLAGHVGQREWPGLPPRRQPPRFGRQRRTGDDLGCRQRQIGRLSRLRATAYGQGRGLQPRREATRLGGA